MPTISHLKRIELYMYIKLEKLSSNYISEEWSFVIKWSSTEYRAKMIVKWGNPVSVIRLRRSSYLEITYDKLKWKVQQ